MQPPPLIAAAADPAQVWRDHLSAGRFMLQCCDDCQRHVFHPRAICPYCSSDRLSWQAANGNGVVYSTTTVSRRPDQGGPYNVALIDLPEDVRLMSRVDGIASDAVTVGLLVHFAIVESEGEPLLVFVPAMNRVVP
ncbi:OB-fold domain-containing protein [soil metagenome]